MSHPIGRLTVAAVIAVSTACTGGDDASDDSVESTDVVGSAVDESVASSSSPAALTTAELTTAATTATTGPPPPPPPNPDCAPAPDRTVTELPDAPVAAVVGAAVDVPALEVDGGDTIPAVHIEGFTIPAQTFDGGCIIEYAAPGGCLGAIEMSGVTLPEIRLPGFAIDAVEIDGEEVSERIVRPPLTIASASAPAVRLEQDCAIVPDPAGALALIREELVRQTADRAGGVREGASRPPICVGEQCSAAVAIDNIVVPAVIVSEVVIPELVVVVQQVAAAPAAQVLEVPGQTAYTAPVDVLFDVEAAELRPDAAPSLQAIATEIGRADPASTVTVEGHTDGDGEPDYNLDLSQRRAQAVTDWLVSQGGIAAERITTIGLGEDVPVASNDTPEGRASNRRVVISVMEG